MSLEQKYKKWIERATKAEIIDGRALLLLGDSREIIRNTRALGVMPDNVICDPPYDFKADGGKLFGRESFAFDDMRKQGLADGFDHEILEELSAAQSMIVFMHNDQLCDILQLLTKPRDCIPREGLEFAPYYERFALCQWHKKNPMPVANKHYIPDTELYIHCWNKPFYPQGELEDKNRWQLTNISRSSYDHPTIKPIGVMEKCVLNGSRAGEDILDPFCGSGSTGVAALKLGRFFIGIEKDEKFFEIAKTRIKIGSGAGIPDDGDQKSLFLNV